jgi:hypothetical protein
MMYMPGVGHTGPKEDYEEAYQIYITAATSVAAYRGRLDELVRRYLHQDGWILDYYVQTKGHSGARFLLARKATEINNSSYILAFVGTDTNHLTPLEAFMHAFKGMSTQLNDRFAKAK